jgi:DNA polymerase-1
MKIIQTANLRPNDRLSADHASWIYNGLDCCVTAECYEEMLPSLDNVAAATYALSRAMQGPILDMNMHGILIDKQSLGETRLAIEDTIEKVEAQLNRIMTEGYGFTANWRSPQQLKIFFYDYLKLPPQRKRNANGKMVLTTDRGALETLEQYMIAAPAISHLLILRDLGKKLGFLSTETDRDGFMRTGFNIAGTNTGRLASSYSDFGTGTNTQNVDRLLRKIFVAQKGKKFANLDLEQADSRNVGGQCWNRFYHSHGERFAGGYLDACESGDLHTVVTKMARDELEWPADPSLWRAIADTIAYRDKSYRDLSKNLGHGKNYLLTDKSAVKKIPGLTIQASVEFGKRYFSAFPEIPEWHKAVRRDLKQNACLYNLSGRRRYFFGRLDDDSVHREGVAYEGQSSTADEINIGLLQLWRGGKRFPGFQLLIQVHDSILFEFDEECEDEILPWALEALRVPIELVGGRQFVVPTEAKTGWNWGDFSPSNPDGLKKWKGGDTRKRLQQPRHRFNPFG